MEVFGYSTVRKPTLNLLQINNIVAAAHKRLIRVTIENLDFRDLIPRYDRPHTLFYLDPPYHDCDYYNYNFTEDDFLDLERILKSIKGKFILSINDDEFTRELFGDYYIEEVNTIYSTPRTSRPRVTELLIRNFPIVKSVPVYCISKNRLS